MLWTDWNLDGEWATKYQIIIVATWLFTYPTTLTFQSLHQWDEAIYANLARHMIRDGFWIIPHMYWSPPLGWSGTLNAFLLKPPLLLWLQAISMNIFGVDVFAARLPSALAALGTAFVVGAITRQVFDDISAAGAGVTLLLLPATYFFDHSGRTGDTDMLLILFGTLLIYAILNATHYDDQRYLILAGLSAGLSVLTKSFAAGIFVVIALPLVAIYWRRIVSVELFQMVGLTVAVAIPWPLYAYLTYPDVFVEQFLLETVRRSQGALSATGTPLFEFMNFPYFELVLTSLGWGPFFITATVFGIIRLYQGRQRLLVGFFLWWLWIVPIFFALTGGNHSWYLFPSVVPIAVLFGKLGAVVINTVWTRLPRDVSQKQLRVLYSFSLVTGAVILAVTYPVIGLDSNESTNPEQIQMAHSLSEAPANEVIYIQDSASVNEPRYYVFSFYVDRPLAETNATELAANDSIKYVIADSDTLQESGRCYDALHSEDSRIVARLC